jgi:hypothetical protein
MQEKSANGCQQLIDQKTKISIAAKAPTAIYSLTR